MTSKREFFNQMAETWDQRDDPADYGRLMRELEVGAGQVVCDVGAGTGVLVPFLCEKVGARGKVYSLDYAEKMIEAARGKNYPANAELMVMDIHETSFPDGFFDQVICNACFPHFEDKAQALKEILRILKSEGRLIVSHPTGRQAVNACHQNSDSPVREDMLVTGEAMREWVEGAGLKVVKMIDEPGFYFLAAERI